MMSVDRDEPDVLFRARLERTDRSSSWGFRLQGGLEFDTPLTLLKVSSLLIPELGNRFELRFQIFFLFAVQFVIQIEFNFVF